MGNLKKENNSCLRCPLLQTSAVYVKHPANNGVTGFQTKKSTLEKQVLPGPQSFPCLKGIQRGKRSGLHEQDRAKS